MHQHRPFPVTALLFAALLIAPTLPALDVGQGPPPLVGVSWINAAPRPIGGIPQVIDLWSPGNDATRATMPKLTDLQSHYGDRVQVIGLTDGNPADVRDVLARMSGRVGYAVGEVASLSPWLPNGITPPVTLIIDSHGTVAWWGDATEAAEPLARLLGGETVMAPPAQAMAAANPPPADPHPADAPSSTAAPAPAPAAAAVAAPASPPQVVYVQQAPPTVVYESAPAPVVYESSPPACQTSVVIGLGFGGWFGFHRGCWGPGPCYRGGPGYRR